MQLELSRLRTLVLDFHQNLRYIGIHNSCSGSGCNKECSYRSLLDDFSKRRSYWFCKYFSHFHSFLILLPPLYTAITVYFSLFWHKKASLLNEFHLHGSTRIHLYENIKIVTVEFHYPDPESRVTVARRALNNKHHIFYHVGSIRQW